MKPIKVLVIEDEIQSFASISRCLQQLYPGCIINGPLTGNVTTQHPYNLVRALMFLLLVKECVNNT